MTEQKKAKQLVRGKLVCVALNDQSQMDNMNTRFNEKPYQKPPTQPVLYFKTHNTWSENGAEVQSEGKEMVVGASMAVVIGRTCCRVSQQDALNYVAGLTLVHDFSMPEESYYRPDIRGKCKDGSAPVAEEAIPLSDLPAIDSLSVVTKVNGEIQRELRTTDFHRGVEALIESISRIMTLDEGDIIAVGFPGKRVPLKDGDTVESTLGEFVQLTNKLVGEG